MCASAARRCWRWSARARRWRASRDADLPIAWQPRAGRLRRRGRAGDGAAPGPCARAGQRADARQPQVRRCRRRPCRGGRDRRGPLRDRLRRARLHRAGGRLRRAASATGSRSPPARRRPTWTARRPRACSASTQITRAHPADRLRRRLRRQARRVGAAAARGGRAGDRRAGAHRLHAHRIDGLDHQAASGHDLGEGLGRRAGPAHRLRDAGRLQHRRLRLLGADGREPRAGARRRALQGAERLEPHARHLHQRHAGRRLPRLRRAAGGDRRRDADGRSRRAARPRPLAHPPHQRARPRRHDAIGPGADAFRRPAGMPRRAEGRTGTRRWRASPPSMRHAPRRRRGVGIACMWYGCGNTSLSNPSTMRIALARDGRLTFFNGAVDIGQGSIDRARCRSPPTRSACRRSISTWWSAIPTSPSTPARPRPRARPSCPATPRGSPALDLRAQDPGARQCRRGCAAEPRRRASSRSATAKPRARSTSPSARNRASECRGDRARGHRHLGPADHAARRRTARASPTPPTASPRRWPRWRSTRRSAPSKVLDIVAAHDVGRAINPTLIGGPDPRRHRAGARPGADGGIHPRPHREPARLSDPDRRRHAARSRSILIEDPEPDRPLRRQGRRRAGADRHRAGHPRRHPPRHRRAHHQRAGAAAPGVGGDASGSAGLCPCGETAVRSSGERASRGRRLRRASSARPHPPTRPPPQGERDGRRP